MKTEIYEKLLLSFSNKHLLTTKELTNKGFTYRQIYECLIAEPPVLEIKTSEFPAPRGNVDMFQHGSAITSKVKASTLTDNDLFRLTELGENILYQLKKEQHMLELAERSLSIAEESLEQSKRSTKYSKYATYAAIASIVTGVLIAAIQFYLN